MEAQENPYLPETFVRKIVFHDGSEMEGTGALNRKTDELWIRTGPDQSFSEMALLFSDKEKTESIEIQYSAISKETFDGYTRLAGILQQKDHGETRILLMRE